MVFAFIAQLDKIPEFNKERHEKMVRNFVILLGDVALAKIGESFIKDIF